MIVSFDIEGQHLSDRVIAAMIYVEHLIEGGMYEKEAVDKGLAWLMEIFFIQKGMVTVPEHALYIYK